MFGLVISILVAVYTFYQALPEVGSSKTALVNQSIVFVTAHPDDEVMFFGPLLRYSLDPKRNNSVNLLCLSNGDAEGLGDIRAQELNQAAAMIGLTPENVTLVNDPALQDSMDVVWDEDVIARYVKEVSNAVDASIFVTFDKYGVSGHPNHVQVAHGVHKYAEKRGVPGDEVLVINLYTVSVFRKYLFIIDGLFSRMWDMVVGRSTVFASQIDYHRVRTAMTTAHKSQMAWFRYLYVSFSRYMIVNSFDYTIYPTVAAPSSGAESETPVVSLDHEEL